MHAAKLDLIFVHVPKTAGNFVQNNLIKLGLTSAKKVVGGGRDGNNRFEITDELTKSKHQSLEQYLAANSSGNLRFFSVYRDPVSRLLSFYMSPHRRTKLYMRNTGVRIPFYFSRFDSSLSEYRTVAPRLPSLAEFRRFVKGIQSTTQKLSPGQQDTGASTLHLLRFEGIETNLESYLNDQIGSKIRINKRPVNESNYPESDEVNDLMEGYHKIVMSTHHSQDYSLDAKTGATLPLSLFDFYSS